MTSVYKGFIYMVPMKNRTKEQMITAYKTTHEYFKNHGYEPKFQHLDNETSNDLETYFNDIKMPFQYCDKDGHRQHTLKLSWRCVTLICCPKSSATILPRAQL